MPKRGDAKPEWGFPNAIMVWNMWPKQEFAGAEVVELSANLKNYAKMPKESGRLKSRLVRSRNTGEKLWEREGKVLRRKQWSGRGPNLWAWCRFWLRFLWVTCVFLKLKLCAFWRRAAHSVHDDFLTIHFGPMKVYHEFWYLWSHS